MIALHLLNLAVFFRTQIFMLPVLLLFYQANHLTVSDFFLFQGIFSFVSLVMEIPAGYIADQIRKKYVLIFSFMLYLTRLFLFVLFPNYWTILFGEIAFALSKAFFSGTSDSYIYDLLKINCQSKQMLKKYGFFNFCMSAGTSIAALMGSWIYQKQGFTVILGIEIVLNILATFLLCFLPNIPQSSTISLTLFEKYQQAFNAIKCVLKNNQINVFIYFSGMLFALTSLFAWSFQPLMKFFSFPVFLFGVVYFINHIFRAVGSFFSSFFLKKIPLVLFGVISYLLFLLSFITLFIMIQQSTFIGGFFVFILMCSSIAGQLIFSIGNITHLHQIVPNAFRSTISSVNTMVGRLLSVLFLISFNFLSKKQELTLDDFQIVYCFECIFFMFAGGLLLHKMFHYQGMSKT